MRCSFGDIVLVPFPFTDLSGQKKRPAVIVSGEAYHQSRPDFIVMAVTSQLRPSAGDVVVAEWKSAGLLKCAPQHLALRVSFRLVAEQSGARWHFSKRVFVMQATKDRFHEDERVRRQAVAVY